MNTALIVALISGAVALASATIAAWTQMRVKHLEQAAREEEARSKARSVLDHYRGPLVDTAWDLGVRVHNILEREFLTTYLAGDRSESAVTSTLFRFAEYLGWVEIVRREVQLLRFDRASDTQRTFYFMSLITRRLATDWYDTAEAQDRAKSWFSDYRLGVLPARHLMLWQEEQRGIGERMMVTTGEESRCIGYAELPRHIRQLIRAAFRKLCRWYARVRNEQERATDRSSRRPRAARPPTRRGEALSRGCQQRGKLVPGR